MYPLIEIKTIPIEIQMKVNHAKLEYAHSTAELEIARDDGGLSIKSRPIRLNIDTFEARNSLSPTTVRSVEQAAQKGQQAVYEATAKYAREGKLLLEAKIGQELVTQFARESQQVNTDFAMDFLPKGGAQLSWDQGEMNIRYEMDKLNFDWRVSSGDYKFTPGNIEISVTQQPDIVIKYIGGPIYVPPSADPSYEPIDTRA